MPDDRAVMIVGAGGIGSALFQDLCRFLPHVVDIHLVDGDRVEGRNLQRQHFARADLGRNKAEALAEKASVAIELDRVYYHPYFLTSPKQLERMGAPYRSLILVGTVDNHPARRVLEAHVRRTHQMTYYLDCANEQSHGEVVAVYRTKSELVGQFRSEYDPSVRTDDRGDPVNGSCGAALDEGNIQTLYTNRKAAIIALELIGAFLRGEVQVGIVFFKDCQVQRTQPWTSVSGF